MAWESHVAWEGYPLGGEKNFGVPGAGREESEDKKCKPNIIIKLKREAVSMPQDTQER